MEFLRADIKRICSKLAENQSLRFEITDCYNYISDYCKKNGVNPSQNTYKVENGRLFINNEYVGIIEVIEQPKMNDFGYYMLDRILSRQEKENIF